VEALDNVVADDVQAGLVIDAGRLVIRGTTWFLRSHRLGDDMAATIARFVPAIAAVASGLPAALAGEARAAVDARVGDLVAAGVPAALALRAATIEPLAAAPDIAECASDGRHDVATVAGVHFALGGRLGLDSLQQAVAALPADGHWQGLARAALHDDVAGLQQALTREVLAAAPTGSVDARVGAWETRHRTALERARRVVDELAHAGTRDLAMVSVALRELRHLAAAGRGGAT
jgi:glutamate dehydrogenase